ncbi:MAG: addiction module protein, partial [Phycisphaerales bacterium]|nr:addiction module protein [Phycisphaerales bacterium]
MRVEPAYVPIPDWHRELLRDRLEAYRADPIAGRSSGDVRAELQQKYPTG